MNQLANEKLSGLGVMSVSGELLQLEETVVVLEQVAGKN